MVLGNLKKLTYIVNTAILLIVFGLMTFFYVIKATFLVYFSIPTALVYVIGYIMISRNHLYGYVVMVYCWLTLYMCVTTVCLGNSYGFNLYCMSMIPIIFYTGYMGRSINARPLHTVAASVVIVAFYLVSSSIPSIRGPIYKDDTGADMLFWIINSIIVFSFLIFYTSIMIRGIIDSEDRLKSLAMKDNLTSLYNRHYILNQLEVASGENEGYFVAMVDIDDFKKINDTYGHNAGDYILKTVADIMSKICKDSLVSRWGGEEFLILGFDKQTALSKMEEVRKVINDTDFTFEGKSIKLSVTIGIAVRNEAETIDKWIQVADDRLYEGKNSGKNRVICYPRQ